MIDVDSDLDSDEEPRPHRSQPAKTVPASSRH